MGVLERFEAVLPELKQAAVPVTILLLVALGTGLGVGFTVGMVLRAEQVANADSRVESRDEKIKKLEDELSALHEGAIPKPATEPTDEGESDRSQATPGIPNMLPEWDPNNRDNKIVEASKSEPMLTDKQIGLFETALKAHPASVKIQQGGRAPKLMSQQLLGAFNSTGWKVSFRETADTRDHFWIDVGDRTAAKTVGDALTSSQIDFHSSDNGGEITFFIRFPESL